MSTERMTELKQELKARIIQHLNLQDRTVESIADEPKKHAQE